jgi:hypothetical protein
LDVDTLFARSDRTHAGAVYCNIRARTTFTPTNVTSAHRLVVTVNPQNFERAETLDTTQRMLIVSLANAHSINSTCAAATCSLEPRLDHRIELWWSTHAYGCPQSVNMSEEHVEAVSHRNVSLRSNVPIIVRTQRFMQRIRECGHNTARRLQPTHLSHAVPQPTPTEHDAGHHRRGREWPSTKMKMKMKMKWLVYFATSQCAKCCIKKKKH